MPKFVSKISGGLDTTPTNSSTNGVESNGVYDALKDKAPTTNASFSGTTFGVSATGIDLTASGTIDITSPFTYFTGGEYHINTPENIYIGDASGISNGGFLSIINGATNLGIDNLVVTVGNLAGSGTRMVTASPTGVLGTQAIPSSAGVTIGNTITSGTNNRILYQSNGNVAQSANLTFDGTTLTTTNGKFTSSVDFDNHSLLFRTYSDVGGYHNVWMTSADELRFEARVQVQTLRVDYGGTLQAVGVNIDFNGSDINQLNRVNLTKSPSALSLRTDYNSGVVDYTGDYDNTKGLGLILHVVDSSGGTASAGKRIVDIWGVGSSNRIFEILTTGATQISPKGDNVPLKLKLSSTQTTDAFQVIPDGTSTPSLKISSAGKLSVPDEAYDATTWNGNSEVPTKNAVRDKIESLGIWTQIKKSNQTQVINNSVTLQSDDALAFTVPASTNVSFRIKVFYETLAAADFKWRLIGSNTPTKINFNVQQAATGTAGTVNNYSAFNSADVTVLGTGTMGSVFIEGIIQNTSSSCVVNFQWAQNTATVGDTRVLTGSYIETMPM